MDAVRATKFVPLRKLTRRLAKAIGGGQPQVCRPPLSKLTRGGRRFRCGDHAVRAKPRQRGACFGVGNDRRGNDVRFANEATDAIRASLGHVELYQAACVQVQRHRRSSSTIDPAVLPVICAGRLALTGLPPVQRARPRT